MRKMPLLSAVTTATCAPRASMSAVCACEAVFLNCWAEERKNKSAKALVQHNTSRKNIVSTGLSRMLNLQIEKLKKHGWKNRLLGSSRHFAELGDDLKVASAV